MSKVYTLSKVTEGNRDYMLSWLRRNSFRNAFAVYDLLYEKDFTQMYVALDRANQIRGYLLIYRRLKYPSVILEGEAAATRLLLEKLKIKRMIMPDIPCELKKVIREFFPSAKFYVEDLMMIKKNEFRPIGNCFAKKLELTDAIQLATLIGRVSKRDIEEYASIIHRFVVYGVFVNGKLVSTARALIQLPELWVIGGVYTHSEYRNRGFATHVTYALTKEALEKAGLASLCVRSDNHSAISAYKKIGYRKVEERIWVDVGTEIKP